MLNLAVILEAAAEARPNKTAFVLGKARWTFEQIDEAANRFAQALTAMGVKPGDRVALSCPNLPEFPIVMFGVLKAGAVFTPLNIWLKPQDIANQLADSGAKTYLCFEGDATLPISAWGHEAFLNTAGCDRFIVIPRDPGARSPIAGVPTLREILDRRAAPAPAFPTMAEDTAILIYTSGTTGEPKGVELSHANLMMNSYLSRDLMQYRSDDVSLIALPLSHIFGLIVQMTAGVFARVTNVLAPRFDAASALALMEREKVSVFCGAPAMYGALLHHHGHDAADLAMIGERLRCCVSVGQSIASETLRGFEARFGATVIEGYGMSETSPIVTFNRLDMPRKIGSVGAPISGVEVKIVDEEGRSLPTGQAGEIWVRGHNVLKRYHNAPQETAAALKDGWFLTGDIGRFDDDGYLFVVDRVKDMINRGGRKIYPSEIEKRLFEHPAISTAAVVGIPDEKYGEEIKAFVVLRSGARISADEIITWAKDRMAGHKYPRRVEFVSALPVSVSGKILRRELREREYVAPLSRAA